MKSKITIGALMAVAVFFVLLYMVFEKVDNGESVKKLESQKFRVGFILLSDTADNGWNKSGVRFPRSAKDFDD